MKDYLELIRANFLLLTPITFLAGVGAAYNDLGFVNVLDSAIALAGALMAHISVNVLNNYFDFLFGIDKETEKTPFSGGVTVLVEERVNPRLALSIGLLTSLFTLVIGVYFFLKYPIIIPIGLLGLLIVLLYSPVLTKIPLMSEISAGIGFGLISLGAYAVQKGEIMSGGWVSFSFCSILVGLLLFLNEFPDCEIDEKAGRRHLVVVLGPERAYKLYPVILSSSYVLLVLSYLLGLTQLGSLLPLSTIPLGAKASVLVLRSKGVKRDELIEAMKLNLVTILLSILLVGIGNTTWTLLH